MAISPSAEDHPGGAPAAVMTAAAAEIATLCERLPASLDDAEILDGVEAAQRLKATLAAWEALAVAEADARDLAKKARHHGSTADWYTHVAGLHRRDGHRFVRHARALTATCRNTFAAMSSGHTSPTQAGIICDAVDQLPSSPALRARGEAFLVEQAQKLTATELARAARHLVHVIDPDRSERRDEAALDREDRAAHLQRFLSVVGDDMGGVRIRGHCSVEDGEILRTALLPLTRPAPATPAGAGEDGCGVVPDPRDHGARMLDALVEVAQHALDSELLPDCHGARPRIAVTLPFEDLRDGLGQRCTTDTGLDVTPGVVRRWACDADLIPVCLASTGAVLDVGRSVRLVTPALWTALVCRDRHCAFPACSRPPVMTQAHHIRHWADGGATSLANLVLLCGEHHRTIHHTPWEVRLNPHDLRPEFRPPPRLSRTLTEEPQPWVRHRPRLE
jgi:hypothetical protein